MAAKLKEIIMDTYLRQVKDILPDLPNQLLQWCACKLSLLVWFFHCHIHKGQSLAIHLPIGGKWHLFQENHARWQHILRQVFVQMHLEGRGCRNRALHLSLSYGGG